MADDSLMNYRLSSLNKIEPENRDKWKMRWRNPSKYELINLSFLNLVSMHCAICFRQANKEMSSSFQAMKEDSFLSLSEKSTYLNQVLINELEVLNLCENRER